MQTVIKRRLCCTALLGSRVDRLQPDVHRLGYKMSSNDDCCQLLRQDFKEQRREFFSTQRAVLTTSRLSENRVENKLATALKEYKAETQRTQRHCLMQLLT